MVIWIYIVVFFIGSIFLSIVIGNFLDKFMRNKFLAAINLVIPDYTPILGKKISSDPYINSVLNDARVKSDIDKIKNTIARFLSLVLSLMFVFFIFSMYLSDRKEPANKQEGVKESVLPKDSEEVANQLLVQFGPFGDLFNGSLTPFLTFATFSGLLITIIMQHMQMRATLAELQISRIEMAESTDALQAQVRNSQAQKIDSNFYSMLQFHMDTVDNLKKDKASRIQNEFHYFNTNSAEWKNFSSPDSYRSFFLINYQILKFIRKHELLGDLSKDEAKQYANILRAVIDDDIYGLIFLNCINDKFYKYKELIEHYGFLEHFVFSSFHDPYVLYFIQSYKVDVFGDCYNLSNFIDVKKDIFFFYASEDKYNAINEFVRLWESAEMDSYRSTYKNNIELIDNKIISLKEMKRILFSFSEDFSYSKNMRDHNIISSLWRKNDDMILEKYKFDINGYLELWKGIFDVIGLWGKKLEFVEEHIKKINIQSER